MDVSVEMLYCGLVELALLALLLAAIFVPLWIIG